MSVRLGAKLRSGLWRCRDRRFGLSRDGNILVELALLGTFLGTLLIGVCDFGMALWEQAEVNKAARAGIEYVSLYGWNQSAAQSAAENATSLAVGASATTYCGCPTGSNVAQQTCGTTCAAYGGSPAGRYASVTTQIAYHPLLTAIWGSSTVTLSSTAVTRY
jgi:Flp pilus assembly protein TadG